MSTSTRIQIDSVMRPRSSSKGRNTSASVTVTVLDKLNETLSVKMTLITRRRRQVDPDRVYLSDKYLVGLCHGGRQIF